MRPLLSRCVMALVMLGISGSVEGAELYDAVKTGKIEIVKSVIADHPESVNEATESGETALHLACRNGQADIAQLLVAAGADVDAVDQRGMTPLRWAVYAQQTGISKALLDNGADVHQVHPVYGSLIDQAFSSACQNGKDPELVELLISYGLEFVAAQVDAMGMSRLDWAVHFGNLPMARFALENGADPNVVSQRLGRTPLVAAVAKGKADLVDLLLQHGADVSVGDKDGNPPVRFAVEKGRTAIFQKLLTASASLDFRESRHQRSLLHLAAINGFADVAGLLISHGCDVNANDDSGATPLFHGARYGHRDIADLLLKKGALKPDGLQENYGVSPYMTNDLPQESAVAWYLNHRGWALKTKNRMLVFDAEEFDVRRPDNPSLANGFLTAKELTNQRVVGLYSCYHGKPGEPAYIHTLADSLSDIAFVHLLDDAWRGSTNTAYLTANQDTVIAGLKVRTISSAGHMPVLSYLCETDGVDIYYQAFATDNLDKLKQDYELLRQYVDTIDIAFLPIPEPGSENESDLRLFLDSFPTRMVMLLDANRREYMFPAVADMIAGWGFKTEVFCAQNPGDHVVFSR